MNELNLSDLKLHSINASWYNAMHKKCSEDDFKIALKAAHLGHEYAIKTYGKDSRAARLTKKKVQYLMNQIDTDKSDIFVLMMFKTDDWTF